LYFVYKRVFLKYFFFSLGEVEFGSAKYYFLCGFGGMLSCGITHTMVVPLDLVKCRMQVNPEKYPGLLSGFKVKKDK
jgi:solute carrier family 25 phosphate transporter 3